MSDHEFGANDDLSLPKATVQKIVTEILPPQAGVAFAKEARDLLIECCVEFITLISSEANEISEKEAKKTIACDHITKALEQLGFTDYVPAVMEAAAEHKETQKGRPRVPRWVARRMGQDESSIADAGPPKTLTERSLPAVAEYIKSGRAKRIVVLTGAGISTSAGIPDFRSPKTGLYNNLARLNLPYAEAVFDISYFRQHPEPFYVLAKELYPGKFHPTVSHVFITLLARKGLLQMLFTQNIDCLERAAGVPSDKIIEAHGSFATQRCIECKTEYPDDEIREHVLKGEVPRCGEKDCGGLVKPDIVFFGEPLPKTFDNNTYQAAMADLVLIIGTSLSVYPFAGLPEMTMQGKPRVLFNMERVGQIGHRSDDVIELGSCDAGIRKLADELGWRDELEQLWREVVGKKEAERQLGDRIEAEERLEDEVEKLAAEVESVLGFKENDSHNDAKVEEGHVSRMAAVLENTKLVSPVEKANATKADGKEEKREVTQVTQGDSLAESTSSPPPPPDSKESAPKELELQSQSGETGKVGEVPRGANQSSEESSH
ncbi:Sir2 family protein [Dactylonectria macrodidyma]|uniref:NCT transcriptional regulatory complex subunit B n=1 Tax=Dactylonectria macrodidyma TaxID=307937 RepID=A0A9P9FG98_9HYPO|nr:Sir2 family protein [Dactylonectria macrodidyma]